MQVFMKAKPIWLKKTAEEDEFAEFKANFRAQTGENTVLQIAADSNYAAWLNGTLVAFGQYPGYPDIRTYDEVDLAPFLCDGKNELFVRVWYYGRGSQTYAVGDAGVIFEVKKDGEAVAYSDEETLSRLSSLYVSHLGENISGQLGFTYHIDTVKEEHAFEKSRVIAWNCEYEKRPIESLVLKERTPSVCVRQGNYFLMGGERAADKMQNAALTADSPVMPVGFEEPLTLEGSGDGCYFIVDTGKENAGFLEFDMEFPEETDMMIGYGEHLIDGRCRTAVRNFAITCHVEKGRVHFMDAFRRLGGRYLQFFIASKGVKVHYAGLRPTEYPVRRKGWHSGDLLREKIWEVAENTLVQCMHEHYEDCPWREQALYTMDSRNQMLCGYYAFGETRFPRASLKLISRSMRKDGFLSICAPDHAKIVIPFFNLVYYIQMREYIDYSGELTLAKEARGVLEKLMQNFLGRIGEDGLVENPVGEGLGYWNFYEWSETLSGEFNDVTPYKDAVLNATLVLALEDYAKILSAIGEDGSDYLKIAQKVRKAIRENFFKEEAGLFATSCGRFEGTYSVLVNALCLLAGAAEGLDHTRMLGIIAENGGGEDIIPATLSMNCFRYDALLKEDKEKYSPVILKELDESYFMMLRAGATSFWETIIGADDFGGAASLCHGWSALPIYYYSILLK